MKFLIWIFQSTIKDKHQWKYITNLEEQVISVFLMMMDQEKMTDGVILEK